MCEARVEARIEEHKKHVEKQQEEQNKREKELEKQKAEQEGRTRAALTELSKHRDAARQARAHAQNQWEVKQTLRRQLFELHVMHRQTRQDLESKLFEIKKTRCREQEAQANWRLQHLE